MNYTNYVKIADVEELTHKIGSKGNKLGDFKNWNWVEMENYEGDGIYVRICTTCLSVEAVLIVTLPNGQTVGKELPSEGFREWHREE
jgi:hypothetical protein